MINVANILYQKNDADRFTKLAKEIKEKYNSTFLDKKTGIYAEDSQSAQAMSLYLGLVPKSPELKEKVMEVLVDNIEEKHESHLSTGIVATYFLYHALSKFNRPDLAYDIITAEGFPGFEYMINYRSPLQAPATTLWEDWAGRSSLCHPVQGCVVSYFYEILAGIKPIKEYPGFKKFLVKASYIDDLEWVEARFDTLHGTIMSRWKKDKGYIQHEIIIPLNTTALLSFPTSDREKITCDQLKSRGMDISECIKQEKSKDKNKICLELGSGYYDFKFYSNKH